MKVAIVGGGPSGLFLSILIKKKIPAAEVIVFEQNAANATFGFGVVMADTGLAHLQRASPEVCTDLIAAMRFNDRQVIMANETPITVQRPGSGGAIPRIRLLEILGDHASRAGVHIHFEHQLLDFDRLDADIIVGADGVNSRLRDRDESAFDTERRHLTNHFAWYGVAKAFPNPSLVFRKYKTGYFVAHYYPYSDDMSTFVAECDHQTWIDFGMEKMSQSERKAIFELVFSSELGDCPLISNNSSWRQFPVIRAHKWFSGNRVLIGDALNSAHFSIGSGTRIAMEDAISLADALVLYPHDGQQALEHYVCIRKPQKQKLIKASEASFTWYENIRQWMDNYDAQEFVYRFMTRTGRVDIDRLRKQYPSLVQGFESAGVVPRKQKVQL